MWDLQLDIRIDTVKIQSLDPTLVKLLFCFDTARRIESTCISL